MPGKEMAWGVRLPDLRALAKRILREGPLEFLQEAGGASYEETVLRGIVIGGLRQPWEEKRPWVESFLPQIDNWAVLRHLLQLPKAPLPSGPAGNVGLPNSPLYPAAWSTGPFCRRAAALPLCGRGACGRGPLPAGAGEASRPDYAKMAVAWALSVCGVVKFPRRQKPSSPKTPWTPGYRTRPSKRSGNPCGSAGRTRTGCCATNGEGPAGPALKISSRRCLP